MSALAMILTAAMAVPGDGPEKVSGEIGKPQRLDLSGKWEGVRLDQEGKSTTAVLNNFTLIEIEWSRACILGWKMQDEGQGRFRLIEAGRPYLGIYEWRRNSIALCYRLESKGRPTSFKAGEDQCLYILHRVKSRK